MIVRKYYLDKIRPYLGKPIVKAITGLRRVGKSVFVRQLIDALRQSGVPERQIVYIDKESLEFDALRDYRDLDRYVKGKTRDVPGKIYVFADEVQDIEQWERAVAAWSGRPERFDITITGSNSTMFSGELATKLTGRYIELGICPLSLSEFKAFYPEYASEGELFTNYLRFGGMPGLRMLDDLSAETAYPFLRSVHDSIVLKDVVRRRAVRNTGLLEAVGDFCYDNIGNPITASSIAAYLKSQRIHTNVQSIINYMQGLEDAELFIMPKRYDIKGRKILEVSRKLYASDLGFRHARLGYKAGDLPQLVENLVFMELRRRYAEVHIGSVGRYEVDFVAENHAGPVYIQVTLNCNDPRTLEREVRPLLAIDDNYPKIIISAEKVYGDDLRGIRMLDLKDFLLNSTEVLP